MKISTGNGRRVDRGGHAFRTVGPPVHRTDTVVGLGCTDRGPDVLQNNFITRVGGGTIERRPTVGRVERTDVHIASFPGQSQSIPKTFR